MGGGGGSNSTSSSSSSTSTTQVSDSYNETAYNTSNISNSLSGESMMLGQGATALTGGVGSGGIQAGGDVRSNIGNVYYGDGPGNSSGFDFAKLTKFLPFIGAGVIILLILKWRK